MARVKQDVQTNAAKMVDQLPDEILNTCGLCNRTLFDQLMQISVKTGAPQKTVCDIFANRYNLNKREEDHVSAKAFKDRIQYIHRMNAKDLSAQSAQISSASNTPSESDQAVNEVCGEQEANSRSCATEESVEPIDSNEPTLKDTTGQNPYEVLIELWRDQQYTSEDVYEVFLTELLGRFSPDDVKQYSRDSEVKLEELGAIIGNTVNSDKEISAKELHREIRSGLQMYGRWSSKKIDSAIGDVPLTDEQLAAWDF